MSTHHAGIMVCTTLLALGLAACSGGHAPSAGRAASASTTGPILGAIDHALDRAATRVGTQDITFGANGTDITVWGPGGAISGDALRITPKGDLFIHGKPVALTGAQRADVLAYREQLVGVAQQGIAIGRQGAALGIHAAGDALAMVFSGQSEKQIHDRVEAQATNIRKAAAALCRRLPALRASQQKLAAAVPAFKPYATIQMKDVDDCEANLRKHHDD